MKKLPKISMILSIASVLVSNLYAISQIKVICDKDGQEIYLNGKFKAECDSGEQVAILVKAGKYTVEVKKDNGDDYYKKSFKVDDGVQKIIKVNSNINNAKKRMTKVWQKTFGGSKNDRANAITPTKDGGFIVAGYTGSFGNGKEDVYLIKIDKNGKSSSGKNLKIAPKEESSSNSSMSSEKSVSVESDCYKNTCAVSVNGSYYGSITYNYNSSGIYRGCYTFTGLGFAYTYCPNFFDSSRRLRGPCGETSAYSLHNAMEKIANCEVNGHY